MALTAKERKFVAEYVKALNASEAARKAGYSERSAGELGYRLLKKVEIQEAIAEFNKAERQAIGMDVERIYASLSKLAANAEKESDRIRALELLGKTNAMFVDRQDVRVKGYNVDVDWD